MAENNGFGLPNHPTDNWVHWHDMAHRKEYVEKVRAAFDKLNAVDPEALKLLMALAQENGKIMEREHYAPEE